VTFPIPGLACDHVAFRARAAELSPVLDGDLIWDCVTSLVIISSSSNDCVRAASERCSK
jgi:hypothetical protein